ncbi:hypothetical protein H4R19_006939 [Coemansia spiralis]|nr:hypothetical protein H4R19_006939 [Coemansia spiralis]
MPVELLTYTRLTHLNISGPVSADGMMEHIHRQPQLVSLVVDRLVHDSIQTDLSIPECAKHEPVASLDTQLRELIIQIDNSLGSSLLSMHMLRYLLLKIPTLRLVTTKIIPKMRIRAFIDEYVQWYPHLANIKLVM